MLNYNETKKIFKFYLEIKGFLCGRNHHALTNIRDPKPNIEGKVFGVFFFIMISDFVN